jgi:predicted anti-sigma-YlaC factor YlaD
MECSAYREAISARIDGEDGGAAMATVDAHLKTCPQCQAWARRATTVTRSVRVGLAEPVPDLTAAIMSATAPPAARMGATSWGFSSSRLSPAFVARLGLLLVSGAQLMLAVPALLGRDPGASVHIAHEQGSWALALAVGLLVVALRPTRAAAMLPLVAALAAGLALTMTLDIWAGRTQAATEAPHGLAFLGLGLLWLLTRDARYGRYARYVRSARAPHTRTGTARPA